MELIIIECISIGRGTGANFSKKGNDGYKTQKARTGTKEGRKERRTRRKEGKKEAKEVEREGKKEGRKEGRKEGKKEGRWHEQCVPSYLQGL